jgi:pentalenene oxygenase
MTSLPAHGDVVRVQIGSVPVYVPCSPEATRHLLADLRTFDTGGLVYDNAREVLGEGLVTSRHAAHQRQRRMIQPAFHKQRLAGYADIMVEQAAAEIDSWPDGEAIDVNARMLTISARATTRVLFSSDAAGIRADEAGDLLRAWLAGMFWRIADPTGLAARLPTQTNRRYRHAVSRMHAAVDQTVEAYRAEGADHGDLLSMLLSARDEDGDVLSTAEIHDQVITFFTGGTESTATAVTWALHTLSTQPDLAHRVEEEVRSALGHGEVGWNTLPHLGLTRSVILEMLRVYPPIWLFTRIATRDAELNGYRIPAGSNLLCSPYLVHHLCPEEDDSGCDPDRWLGADPPQRFTGAYIPFGGGVRKCIADEFSLTEATLVLALVIARVGLEPVPGKPVRPIPRTTLRPSTLVMRVHRRRLEPGHAAPGSTPDLR